MGTELEALRAEIDNVDREILEIIEDRFEICKDIARVKRGMNIPIRDDSRESVIIETRQNMSGLNKEFVEELFGIILKESKRIQEKDDA